MSTGTEANRISNTSASLKGLASKVVGTVVGSSYSWSGCNINVQLVQGPVKVRQWLCLVQIVFGCCIYP